MAARRVLVTGGAGNVAGWLARTAPVGVDLHVTGHRTPVPEDVASVASVHPVDLRRGDEVSELLGRVRPDVVLHTAYVQSEREAIVDASREVALGARSVGASMVHMSTDVVFSGTGPPYGEEAEPDPVTDYGRWKLESERMVGQIAADVCITRTSLVVSLDPMDRSTATFARDLGSGDGATMFTDEMRQPIRAEDLASELWALVALDRSDRAGVWHLPGPEHLSRQELGERLAARLGLDPAGMRAARAADVAPGRPRDPQLTSRRRRRLGVRLRPVDA